MKKVPTFSIVTPSYNQAQFIEETLMSVITQKGDFKIEYIIADGKSTDNSVEIIKRVEADLKSGKIKPNCKGISFSWWSKRDSGQSEAINNGFKKATGDYIAWLNSDDYYTPGTLQQAKEAFDKYDKAGLIYADYDMVAVDGKLVEAKHGVPFDLSRLIHDGNFIAQPASFMRRSALMKVGLLNPEYHYAMDYDLWIRIGESYPVQYIPGKIWAKFRLHEDSKTVSLEKKFWKDEKRVSKEHGGGMTSPLFKRHYFGNRPRLLAFLNKLGRGYLMLKNGSLKQFVHKLKKNIFFWSK